MLSNHMHAHVCIVAILRQCQLVTEPGYFRRICCAFEHTLIWIGVVDLNEIDDHRYTQGYHLFVGL